MSIFNLCNIHCDLWDYCSCRKILCQPSCYEKSVSQMFAGFSFHITVHSSALLLLCCFSDWVVDEPPADESFALLLVVLCPGLIPAAWPCGRRSTPMTFWATSCGQASIRTYCSTSRGRGVERPWPAGGVEAGRSRPRRPRRPRGRTRGCRTKVFMCTLNWSFMPMT